MSRDPRRCRVHASDRRPRIRTSPPDLTPWRRGGHVNPDGGRVDLDTHGLPGYHTHRIWIHTAGKNSDKMHLTKLTSYRKVQVDTFPHALYGAASFRPVSHRRRHAVGIRTCQACQRHGARRIQCETSCFSCIVDFLEVCVGSGWRNCSCVSVSVSQDGQGEGTVRVCVCVTGWTG